LCVRRGEGVVVVVAAIFRFQVPFMVWWLILVLLAATTGVGVPPLEKKSGLFLIWGLERWSGLNMGV